MGEFRMNKRHFFSSLFVIGAALLTCQVNASGTDDKKHDDLLTGLSGRIFAVEAEIVFSLDPALSGFNVGDTFNNCYVFKEDNVWIDPLFPTPGAAVPGGWVQHTKGRRIKYTAMIVETVFSGAPLLTQTGTIYRVRGKSKRRLTAYTTVWAGSQPFVEVVSRGRQISKRKAATVCPPF
jgi:hypothetical protein